MKFPNSTYGAFDFQAFGQLPRAELQFARERSAEQQDEREKLSFQAIERLEVFAENLLAFATEPLFQQR